MDIMYSYCKVHTGKAALDICPDNLAIYIWYPARHRISQAGYPVITKNGYPAKYGAIDIRPCLLLVNTNVHIVQLLKLFIIFFFSKGSHNHAIDVFVFWDNFVHRLLLFRHKSQALTKNRDVSMSISNGSSM